ncbi:MAG: RAMP superfamily CRISPR-associated protein [Candidatus Thorarchaeota archaeon]
MNKSNVWMRDTPVNVVLTISTPFRVGGARGEAVGADLPVLSVEYNGGLVPVIPASSIRGVLRDAVETLVYSCPSPDRLIGCVETLFGSLPPPRSKDRPFNPGPTKAGVVRIVSRPIQKGLSSGKIVSRRSVRINDVFGTAEHRALFDYECVEPEAGSDLSIEFGLWLTYPLDELTAAVLLGGLRMLKYAGIGGFKSRGMGLITNVKIDPEFVREAEGGLREVFP